MGAIRTLQREVKQNGASAPVVIPDNIEELAATARREREQKCNEAVAKVLADHNCQMSLVFKIGEQVIPVERVITFPTMVLIGSK